MIMCSKEDWNKKLKVAISTITIKNHCEWGKMLRCKLHSMLSNYITLGAVRLKIREEARTILAHQGLFCAASLRPEICTLCQLGRINKKKAKLCTMARKKLLRKTELMTARGVCKLTTQGPEPHHPEHPPSSSSWCSINKLGENALLGKCVQVQRAHVIILLY